MELHVLPPLLLPAEQMTGGPQGSSFRHKEVILGCPRCKAVHPKQVETPDQGLAEEPVIVGDLRRSVCEVGEQTEESLIFLFYCISFYSCS